MNIISNSIICVILSASLGIAQENEHQLSMELEMNLDEQIKSALDARIDGDPVDCRSQLVQVFESYAVFDVAAEDALASAEFACAVWIDL